ncbi:metal ABC transporter substrate-binding protein [Actinophytocola xanthii]|uniref:Zinc ABC transporter substrate-binding protein n=1 Tax=Actinophytocola xanthii TaxID=1912961 RepID=A0A1Q8CMC3_9PSEU|nr:metal ABC transporter substrate-binding protein [Actinophytocola xanthii]OLF15508.1 zinc ABC transporter substrate-binding protein [Actinophytocola xanthii]
MRRVAPAALLAVLVACAPEGSAEEPGLQVVTTVAPLTSIVADVVGDRGRVTGLVPEGTNSHTFDPPPSAGEALALADVVFVNGLRLEEPTVELAERTIESGTPVVELGSVLPESEYIYDFSFPREEGKPNPHLWTDPTFAARYAEKVRDTLVELDPDGAEDYRANAAAFVARADGLADALRADQESLPRERRELLTYHDAYAYFARTFGWRVVGAIQPENFEDPTPREVAALIDQVRREDVRAVFGSEVFPSRVLEQIGAATGVRYVDVLRDDDLPGEPGDPEHSWLGLMRFDYVTMIEALGGSAPALRALEIEDVSAADAHYPQ